MKTKKIFIILLGILLVLVIIYFVSALIEKNKKHVNINEVQCPDVYRPVCGTDNKSYQNSCFALKAGVKIKSLGACPSGF